MAPTDGRPLPHKQALENATLCLNAAKAMGCVLAHVSPADIVDGQVGKCLLLQEQPPRPHLMSRSPICCDAACCGPNHLCTVENGSLVLRQVSFCQADRVKDIKTAHNVSLCCH